MTTTSCCCCYLLLSSRLDVIILFGSRITTNDYLIWFICRRCRNWWIKCQQIHRHQPQQQKLKAMWISRKSIRAFIWHRWKICVRPTILNCTDSRTSVTSTNISPRRRALISMRITRQRAQQRQQAHQPSMGHPQRYINLTVLTSSFVGMVSKYWIWISVNRRIWQRFCQTATKPSSSLTKRWRIMEPFWLSIALAAIKSASPLWLDSWCTNTTRVFCK